MIKLKELIKNFIYETLETGEWWIYPGGDVQFADGDVGDSGHEGYVIEYVAHEILSQFGVENTDPGYIKQYHEEIKQSLIDDDDLTLEEINQWNDGEVY